MIFTSMPHFLTNLLCAFVWNKRERNRVRAVLNSPVAREIRFIRRDIKTKIFKIKTFVGYQGRSLLIAVNDQWIYKFPLYRSDFRKLAEHEKRIVSTHEAGHAVVGLKMKNAEEVVKITVIPRGDAGGYCMSTPKEERFVQTAEEIRERICGLLGGRIAEELVIGSTTTGAHNDLEKATHLARSLVMDYGLSSLGVAQLRKRSGSEVQDYNVSERTKERVDEEINKIIGMCYEETRDLIRANMDLLNLIADTLMEKETINKEEIQQLVERGQLVQEKEEMVAIETSVPEPCLIVDTTNKE